MSFWFSMATVPFRGLPAVVPERVPPVASFRMRKELMSLTAFCTLSLKLGRISSYWTWWPRLGPSNRPFWGRLICNRTSWAESLGMERSYTFARMEVVTVIFTVVILWASTLRLSRERISPPRRPALLSARTTCSCT